MKKQKPTRLNKDDFAKLMMDSIRQTGENGKIAYEPEEFRLRGEGKNFAMFFTNGYMEYCAAPLADRGRVIRHYVRKWVRKGYGPEFPEQKEHRKRRVRS